MFINSSPKLSDFGRKVMQRMSWLLAQHILVYKIDSHTNKLDESLGSDGEDSWMMSLLQGQEVNELGVCLR
jgi:hypothetical protein